MFQAWDNFFLFINRLLTAADNTAIVLETGSRVAVNASSHWEQSLKIDNAKEIEAKLKD